MVRGASKNIHSLILHTRLDLRLKQIPASLTTLVASR